MTPRQRFAQEYGITAPAVTKLRNLLDRFAKDQEHATNGTTHVSTRFIPRQDKETHSRAWEIASEQTLKQLAEHVKKLGFAGLDFNSGLYPTLVKGNDRFIIVPE